MKREHKWNKEDALINLFYWRFGTKGLLITDEKELVESAIGSSLAALKLNNLNFEWLNGNGSYCDISNNQREVFAEHLNTPYEVLKDIVNDIILTRDLAQNQEEYKAAKKIRDAKLAKKLKEKKKQDDLDAIWIRLGKDPKKMRKV